MTSRVQKLGERGRSTTTVGLEERNESQITKTPDSWIKICSGEFREKREKYSIEGSRGRCFLELSPFESP